MLQVSEGRIDRLPETGTPESRVLIVQQENSLFPWMTALENAAFGLKATGIGKAEREGRAREWLSRLGLDGREHCYPDALSTGMKQRVAVARCFLSEPAMLLMDEPFGALDAQTRMSLQQELLALWEPGRRSVIFVTHDVEEAILLSDRILLLSPQPGTVVSEIAIPLGRPRPPAIVLTSEFIRIKGMVFEELGLERTAPLHA
jgi:NitT/TauT family transport system ATP-binding protein